MGRVLVIPPAQKMYLLQEGKEEQRTKFGFVDFFPIEEIAAENDGLDIITMKEFLETEAMVGHMRNKDTGRVSFPPGNRTDWEGHQDVHTLKEWLRTVAYTPSWNPDRCLAVFPASRNHKDTEALKAVHKQVLGDNRKMHPYLDNPAPVDSTPLERMKENLSSRQELCIYDEIMQRETFVHFVTAHKLRMRLLVHFYAFLFFEDWREVRLCLHWMLLSIHDACFPVDFVDN